jgi:hypothetical protein
MGRFFDVFCVKVNLTQNKSDLVNWWEWVGFVFVCFFFSDVIFLQLFIVWDYFFSNYILQHVFQQKTKFNVKKNNSQHSKFLIKTPLEHSTQTIFEGSSPWATLIFNSMFVVWVLCCVKLFSWLNIFINCVMCSFSLAFLFYLLSSILLDVSKCLISHNIGCLIKTLLIKKPHPNICCRGSPSATLFSIVCLL